MVSTIVTPTSMGAQVARQHSSWSDYLMDHYSQVGRRDYLQSEGARLRLGSLGELGRSRSTWSCVILMILVASWRNSASCHPHRGPSNSGPTHLSWSTVAIIYPYRSIYRFIPAEVLPAPRAVSGSRYCHLSGRLVRWRKRMVDSTKQ